MPIVTLSHNWLLHSDLEFYQVFEMSGELFKDNYHISRPHTNCQDWIITIRLSTNIQFPHNVLATPPGYWSLSTLGNQNVLLISQNLHLDWNMMHALDRNIAQHDLCYSHHMVSQTKLRSCHLNTTNKPGSTNAPYWRIYKATKPKK